MRTEITQIKLELKDRVIELTVQEARDVQKELNKLFQMEISNLDIAIEKLTEQLKKEQTKKMVPLVVYPNPFVIERSVPYWPEKWEITCGDNPSSGTLCMSVGITS